MISISMKYLNSSVNSSVNSNIFPGPGDISVKVGQLRLVSTNTFSRAVPALRNKPSFVICFVICFVIACGNSLEPPGPSGGAHPHSLS